MKVTTNQLKAMAVILWMGAWIFISTTAAGEEQTMATERIRESVIAGSWYPGNEKDLRKTIQGYLDKVPDVSHPGKLVALISPHAGYVYSGLVAAYSYKILEKYTFDSVVVISPSHYARFDGVSVYDKGGYRTPLGVFPLDTDLVNALKEKDSRIRYMAQAHAQEHSLEIQLPFIQMMLPKAKLIPLVMGNQSYATCEWLAKALVETIKGKSVLIVASSDLSHFHNAENAKELDNGILEMVEKYDPQGLNRNIDTGKSEACGGGPIVATMLAARELGATRSQVLKYAHSGDVSGDNHRVVGYMAAALWNNPGGSKTHEPEDIQKVGVDLGLSVEEKKLLRQVAHETIELKLNGKSHKTYDVSKYPTLQEPRGAFVTLTKNGQLRGCIGHIVAHYPLIETITSMAVSAAFEDPRFPPLQSSEFKDIEIEISVLTPFEKITDVNKIEVGIHGIYIKKGYASGLLLPQVATEYGWDRNTFLQHTCRKAGLPLNAWQDKNAEIYIFSADIF